MFGIILFKTWLEKYISSDFNLDDISRARNFSSTRVVFELKNVFQWLALA